MNEQTKRLSEREWKSGLSHLSDKELRELCDRIAALDTEAVREAERRHPGKLADRIIEQIERYGPSGHFCQAFYLPKMMTGGKDMLDYAGDDCQRDRLDYYWWPKLREHYRQCINDWARRITLGSRLTYGRMSRRRRINVLARALSQLQKIPVHASV